MARVNITFVKEVRERIKKMPKDKAISYVRGTLLVKVNEKTEEKLREILHELVPESYVPKPKNEPKPKKTRRKKKSEPVEEGITAKNEEYNLGNLSEFFN